MATISTTGAKLTGPGRRDFVVARRGMPAVCVRLDGGRHDEITVSSPNAEAIADEIIGV